MDNKVVGKRIALLRKKRGLSQEEFAKKINVSPSTVAMWEVGKREVKSSTLSELADFFNVSTDYLLGRTDNPSSSLPELTEREERNIQRELEKIIEGLSSKNGFAAFGGMDIDELDEEDRELLIASLENSLRLAKRIAKEKFTPKKHRKD
ncbi:transcriptional regulator with XRE-family HTH domain [Anoxybacillus tengchongensis]|uniref:Transcriptional regulator with XRE-family HTH domain n=1 Tax=Anoxybacillus tengchongensis TaxID=576944 RepID=A0A7W9YQD6_9BACL|nr:helix-turn-helix transcriptional regulator [Anoxybacillus tengchongensis]MBB6176425.1 transcriptional regulator with XRE-family HTH domain [Anoxybacillus tengchongensis]